MKMNEKKSKTIKEQFSVFCFYWGFFAILVKIAGAFEYGGSNILHESSIFEIAFFAITFYVYTIVCIPAVKSPNKRPTSSQSREPSDKQILKSNLNIDSMSKITSYISRYWLLALVLLCSTFIVYEYFHVFFGLYWFLVFFTPLLIGSFSLFFTGVLEAFFDIDVKHSITCACSFIFLVLSLMWLFLGDSLYYKL